MHRDGSIDGGVPIHRWSSWKDDIGLAVLGACIFAEIVDGAGPDRNQRIRARSGGANALYGFRIRMWPSGQEYPADIAKPIQSVLDPRTKDLVRNRIAHDGEMPSELQRFYDISFR